MLRLKHKHHASFLLVVTATAIVFGALFLPTKALAADITCPDGFQTVGPLSERDVICANHKTGGPEADSSSLQGDCKDTDISKNCSIVEYLKILINVLSGLVGVVIVIMITVGGIQYSAARDNPQAAAAAKSKITNAVMALVFYLFIFAFLQYIVPGGVL
jgi:hypothetical protein